MEKIAVGGGQGICSLPATALIGSPGGQVDVNDLYLLCRKEEWSNNGQVIDAHTVFMLSLTALSSRTSANWLRKFGI